MKDGYEIIEIIKSGKFDVDQVEENLYEICDEVHSTCDCECPVYRLNGEIQPGKDKGFKINRGCDTFKNGSAMLEFLKARI